MRTEPGRRCRLVEVLKCGVDDMADDDRKGIMWRLPKLHTHDWGNMGPAFGYGIGCGVGLGAGIVGGSFVLSRLSIKLV